MKSSPFFAIGIWAIAIACCAASSDTKQEDMSEYPLNPKCGPWMVMVKSFRGPEAIETANKLARELREKHKIPAYTFIKPLDPSQAQPVQQVGMVRGRVRQFETAAVLAGDCPNERAAGKLQDKIHKIRPDCITQEMVPVYQWKAGVLRTAFCLPNPMVPGEPPKPDPVLIRINSGKNSIFKCTGEYTIEAALFTGGIAYTKKQADMLEKTSMLEAAGEHAEVVCDELLKKGYDAYVFHGLSFSIVAVGSFSNQQDPQIDQLRRQLAGMDVGAFKLSPSPSLMKVPKRS